MNTLDASALGLVVMAIGCGSQTPAKPPVVETIAVQPGSASPAPLPAATDRPGAATADSTLDPVPSSAAPSAVATAPAGTPGCPQFDRAAAAKGLGAVNLQQCARTGGPRGSGHIKIVFAVDGHVSAATIDSGAFVNTPDGACIVNAFRNVHIPAFCGAPVSIGKSFTIN